MPNRSTCSSVQVELIKRQPAPQVTELSYQYARSLVLGARKHSSELLRASRRTLTGYLVRARARARREGYQIGLAAGEAESVEKLLHYQRAFELALREAQQECVDLALRVASEISATLCVTTSSLLARIEREMNRLLTTRALSIKVHPDSVAKVTESLRSREVLALAECITGDPTIAPGNLRICTVSGSIDVSWEMALDHLAAALREGVATKPLLQPTCETFHAR